MSDLLSPADVRHIDHVCDQFEADWRAGQRPAPADFLGETDGSRRAALLRQLLLLDWEYRRMTGESPSAADYHARFPSDASVVESVESEMSQKEVSTFTGDHGTHPPTADGGPNGQPTVAVPRYELADVVGQGGIGVVYRGRDRQLGREVAMKVLREEYRDRPDARRRFVNEARVGSRLQHPAIVPVYDQGWFDDRRPYLTMRLVRGQTLAAQLKDRPNPGHDLPRLLGVFEQVCQAIAYAHAQGVVHRDLKPANVMVGSFGEVQVMDWGFAKDLRGVDLDGRGEGSNLPSGSAASETQSGVLMGTPAYMSPEQARGESALIDPRTDVFALGAILCEILTGRPPYTASSPDDLCHQAATGDLTDARVRLEACGADATLRQLAVRCLEPDRATRPADANEVARQVTDFLRSVEERVHRAEVERAEAQGKVRAERRARRLLAGLAVALLLGAGVAVWQAVVATLAKQDALTAAAAEAVAKRTAEAKEAEARTAVEHESAAKRTAEAKEAEARTAAKHELEAKRTAEAKEAETQSVLDFVELRILAAGRPKNRPGGLGPNVTLWAALDAAEPYIAESFKDQPLTEARVRRTLAGSLQSFGNGQAAARQLETVVAIYERVLDPDAHDTLVATNNLATGYVAQNRTQDGVRVWEQLLRRCRDKLGDDADLTLSCMNNLAAGYMRLGHLDKAETMLKEVLELAKKGGPHNRTTLMSLTNLAAVYSQRMQYEKALKLGIETWQTMKKDLGEDDHETLIASQNIAINCRKLQKYDDAVVYDQMTLNGRIKTLTRVHPETIQSVMALAQDYIFARRGAEAVPELEEFIRACKDQPVHRDFMYVVDLRFRISEGAKDAAGCRAAAELWEEVKGDNANSLYTAARFRAVVAKLMRSANGSDAEADRAADFEADRAMAWLEQAVSAGFKDVKTMKGEKDLADLRNRPDFQRLVAKLAGER